MSSQYDDYSKIVDVYKAKHAAIKYPVRPSKPLRIGFPNNKTWGEALDQWEIDSQAFTEKRKQYGVLTDEVISEFKQELAKYYGVENHPKLDSVWEFAWEHGHSSGFSDIAIYFDQFVQLIKD